MHIFVFAFLLVWGSYVASTTARKLEGDIESYAAISLPASYCEDCEIVRRIVSSASIRNGWLDERRDCRGASPANRHLCDEFEKFNNGIILAVKDAIKTTDICATFLQCSPVAPEFFRSEHDRNIPENECSECSRLNDMAKLVGQSVLKAVPEFKVQVKQQCDTLSSDIDKLECMADIQKLDKFFDQLRAYLPTMDLCNTYGGCGGESVAVSTLPPEIQDGVVQIADSVLVNHVITCSTCKAEVDKAKSYFEKLKSEWNSKTRQQYFMQYETMLRGNKPLIALCAKVIKALDWYYNKVQLVVDEDICVRGCPVTTESPENERTVAPTNPTDVPTDLAVDEQSSKTSEDDSGTSDSGTGLLWLFVLATMVAGGVVYTKRKQRFERYSTLEDTEPLSTL